MSDTGFVLILLGGLWLTLWQRRWRLAGLPLIIAGIALAPGGPRPDILIGREGSIVALRTPSGGLKVHARQPSTFELTRWLEHEGDVRDLSAVRAARGLACDALGCNGASAGKVVAISHHPAGLADDCARADILIVDGRAPSNCLLPRWIYDRAALRSAGSIFLYAEGDGLRERTVARERGQRPWSAVAARSEETGIAPPHSAKHGAGNSNPPKLESAPPLVTGRLAAFAAPGLTLDTGTAPFEELRAEIEDDPY